VALQIATRPYGSIKIAHKLDVIRRDKLPFHNHTAGMTLAEF
jgi:hypothetical protein